MYENRTRKVEDERSSLKYFNQVFNVTIYGIAFSEFSNLCYFHPFVDEAELSDIPFSSEEDEPDAGEHDSGSDWTSDDDPEKLWCICRKPHDGK